MKVLVFISILVVGVSLQEVSWLPKSGQKKIQKTFIKLWKDKEIKTEQLNLDEQSQKEIGFKIRKETLYKINEAENLVGYMYLDKAPSKFDKFDYMVIFNPDLTIKAVTILVYREDQGGEIMSNSFLKQFIGKNSFSKFELGRDVQGISGATISCRSTTEGVKKLSKRIFKLKQAGKLK